MPRSTTNRLPRLGVFLLLCGPLLGGCDQAEDSGEENQGFVISETGSAEASITSEVERLTAASSFAFLLDDFSGTQESGGEFVDSIVQWTRSGSHGFLRVVPDTIPQSDSLLPLSLSTNGSRAHLRLDSAGEIRFIEPMTVLGFQVSFTLEQAEALRSLEPTSGFNLPEFRLLVTAIRSDGSYGPTLRVIPAAATYKETRVDSLWTWTATAQLGTVKGLAFHIEAPDGIRPTLLFDNLVVSRDYQPDRNYFTIGLIPDTQKYVENLVNSTTDEDIFRIQTQWLADHVDFESIRFVSHLGDLVEHGELESEWKVASRAIEPLEGVVPFGVVIGNHDFVDEWNHPEDGSPYFLQYFPESRFSGYEWWGGISANGLSSFQIFDTPMGKFLALHLMVDSPPPTLDWADSVLSAHPDIPAMVTTHAYLRSDGRIPVAYLSGAVSSWNGISADSLFHSFLATHDQIFLVTCGHISDEYTQVSQNQFGHPVFELLQDYQNRENGGEGFLRLLRFYPERKKLEVVTYSPWLNTYEVDANSHLWLDMK